MKAKHIVIFLCVLMVVAGTACKNENAPENNQVAKRHLTIKMKERAGMPVRRITNATIEDLGTTLLAEWTEGDRASYCNLSRRGDLYYDPIEDEEVYTLFTGDLTAASTGKKSDLNGDVDCTAEDFLAVVYPANVTFEYTDAGTQYSYTFPLAEQDGTSDRLATHYNQQYGRAHITAVTDKTAEAWMEIMQPLLTICKFSFVDAANDNPIPVGTLTICYEDATSENGKYPQAGKVTITVVDENHEVVATEKLNVTDPLTVTCPTEMDEVYVSMMPTIASRTYRFTVTNSTGTYSGTASALLNKGEFVPATGLKLTKN